MSDYTFADVNKIQNTVLTINQSGFAGEENILWLGTNYGVKTFDILTNTFTDYKSDEHNDIKGVPGLGFCFEPTRTEGMWIGTYKGLHRYDPFKQNVKVINTSLPGGQSDWALGDVCFEQGSQRDSIIWFSIDYISFSDMTLFKKLAPIPAVLKNIVTMLLQILYILIPKTFYGYHLTIKDLLGMIWMRKTDFTGIKN